MNKLFAITLITLVAVAIAPNAAAEQKLDIVQIMGQFVQASYAASRCINPDQETLARFLLNYKMVSLCASEELRVNGVVKLPRPSMEIIATGRRCMKALLTTCAISVSSCAVTGRVVYGARRTMAEGLNSKIQAIKANARGFSVIQ